MPGLVLMTKEAFRKSTVYGGNNGSNPSLHRRPIELRRIDALLDEIHHPRSRLGRFFSKNEAQETKLKRLSLLINDASLKLNIYNFKDQMDALLTLQKLGLEVAIINDKNNDKNNKNTGIEMGSAPGPKM